MEHQTDYKVEATGLSAGSSPSSGGSVEVTSLPALPAGDNNIGNVDVVTLPVSKGAGAVDASTVRVALADEALGAAAAATGTFILNDNPADGEILDIYDGVEDYVFEFDSGDGVEEGNIAVTIGLTREATFANLMAAIALTDMRITAVARTDTVCDLTHTLKGTAYNQDLYTDSTAILKSGMSGGLDAGSLNAVRLASDVTVQLGPGNERIGSVQIEGDVTLGAGTQNIGNVAINGTVTLESLPAGTQNIGDVDVASLPALAAGSAIVGKVGIDQTTMGSTNAVMEVMPALTWLCSTTSTSGDTTLVAAPGAGKRFVVKFLQIQNESATATTVLLKSDAVVKFRILGQSQGDSCGYDKITLRWEENDALIINLSGANSIGYIIGYYEETI